jgi:uncharacterized protein (UPF0147 family)
LHVRKPHYADLDLKFGANLEKAALDAIMARAIKNGTPEARFEEGWEEDLFTATISDETRDRYGDRILVAGWDLKDYDKNPVLLFGHDYESFSVGHALDIFKENAGKAAKAKGKKKARPRLRGTFLWSRANPEARILKELYADGDMRAFSVGFIPDKFRIPSNDEERDELDLGEWGVLHQKQTLLENSAVPVPANPNAVQEDGLKAIQDQIPEDELPGLRKLAERLKGVNDELARGLAHMLPSTKKQVSVKKDVDPTLAPTTMETGVIPRDVSLEVAPEGEGYETPVYEAFSAEPWDKLNLQAKRKIMGHYGWSAHVVNGLEELRFPHHEPAGGRINLNGVLASVGELDKAESLKLTLSDTAAVKTHLRRHLTGFDREHDSVDCTDEEITALLVWVEASKGKLMAKIAADSAEMKGSNNEKADAIFRTVAPEIMGESRAAMTPTVDMEKVEPPVEEHDPNPSKTEAPAEIVDVKTDLYTGDEKWAPPVAEDFPDWEGLDADERSVLSGFFAYTAEMPPESFASLLLPHHRADDGLVSPEGVRAAMEDLTGLQNGAENIAEEHRDAAFDHLATHFEAMGEEPPERMYGDGTAEGSRKPRGMGMTYNPDNLKGELLATLRRDLGLDVPTAEKAGAERKWRVVRNHKPETAPEDTIMPHSEWDKAVGDNYELRRQTCLIYDAADVKNPRSYLFEHHLAQDGTPVVWSKVQQAMRLLLSKSVDSTIPENVRRRAYYHLRTHFDQFGKEAPAFRAMEQLSGLARFLTDCDEAICDGNSEVRESAELMLDLVYMGYQTASDQAYEIQALSFETSLWEKDDAESFVKQHGFSADSFAEAEGRYVFSQREASHFVGGLIARKLSDEPETEGVSTLGGKLKSQAGLLTGKVDELLRAVTTGFAEVGKRLSGDAKKANSREFLDSIVKGRKDGEDNFSAILDATTKAQEETAKAVAGLQTNQGGEE